MTKSYFSSLKMKTTSTGRRPQNIKSGISQQPLYGMSSEGEIIGNLECGSAQPSLFSMYDCGNNMNECYFNPRIVHPRG